MQLEILTAEKTLFKGRVKNITVPGKSGSFTILMNHAPIVSTLNKGEVSFTTRDFKEEKVYVGGGVIEVKSNEIIILANV